MVYKSSIFKTKKQNRAGKKRNERNYNKAHGWTPAMQKVRDAQRAAALKKSRNPPKRGRATSGVRVKP